MSKLSELQKFYKKPARNKANFSGPIVFVIVVVAVIFVMSVMFRVSDIRVNGNTHYTDNEIINAIDIEEGDNLFFFDRFAAISRVFAKLPYVEEVTVTRHLPNRVIIDVVESKAVAYIPLGAEYWTIDKNCKVLGKAAEGEESELVEITGFQPGTLFINEPLTTADGEQRPVEHLTAILQQVLSRNLIGTVTRVDMTNVNAVIMYYGNDYTVKLGDPYGTDHKFAMIVSCVSKLLPGDTGVIDVSDATTCHFIPY